MMGVSWWDPELEKKYPALFFNPFQVKRNFLHIKLSGDNKTDLIKLNHSQLIIRKIVQNKDSINGVFFHFSDTARYWTLVKALDICKIENINLYAPYKNDLCIYYIPSDNIPMFVCGTDSENTFLTEIYEFYQLYNIPSIQYLIVGFLAFSIVAIISIWKKFL